MKNFFILFFISIALFGCTHNPEIENEKQEIAEEKMSLENEKKQLEEEGKKIEEQEQKKKSFVADNIEGLFKNEDFMKGKIWGYVRQKNETTDKDMHMALLYSTKRDKDSLGNIITPTIVLLNHDNSNTVTLGAGANLTPRYDQKTDAWYVDIPIRILPLEVETYTFKYDISEKTTVVMQEEYVEKFVQNLRKSEKMIMVLDFEYGGDGNYEFLTAGMEF